MKDFVKQLIMAIIACIVMAGCTGPQPLGDTGLILEDISKNATDTDLTILTANAMGSGPLISGDPSVGWQDRIDRLANLIVSNGTLPDIISLTEFEGWRWCFPAWSAGDYDIADRLIWRLRNTSTSKTLYRIAYMVGTEIGFGPFDRCHVYTGDIVLYNPDRLVNRTPEDAKRFLQQVQAHDTELVGIQIRRSLPLCSRGTTLMQLDQLIDGSPQTDKCGRPMPSGPAWVVETRGQYEGVPFKRIGSSLARFAFKHDPNFTFDVFTVHPRAGAEMNDATPIENFINGLSIEPYRTTQRYYPPLVVGDFNNLVQPDPGSPDWPLGVSTIFFADVLAVKLGQVTKFPASYTLNPVQRLVLPPEGSSIDQNFSDHPALLVRFTRIPVPASPPPTP